MFSTFLSVSYRIKSYITVKHYIRCLLGYKYIGKIRCRQREKLPLKTLSRDLGSFFLHKRTNFSGIAPCAFDCPSFPDVVVCVEKRQSIRLFEVPFFKISWIYFFKSQKACELILYACREHG